MFKREFMGVAVGTFIGFVSGGLIGILFFSTVDIQLLQLLGAIGGGVGAFFSVRNHPPSIKRIEEETTVPKKVTNKLFLFGALGGAYVLLTITICQFAPEKLDIYLQSYRALDIFASTYIPVLKPLSYFYEDGTATIKLMLLTHTVLFSWFWVIVVIILFTGVSNTSKTSKEKRGLGKTLKNNKLSLLILIVMIGLGIFRFRPS